MVERILASAPCHEVTQQVPCKSLTECDLRKQIKTECKNFELPIIQEAVLDR